ncbi:MAG: hypothetical protein RLZZ162_1784 [Verrucomicrobiota bacterium]
MDRAKRASFGAASGLQITKGSEQRVHDAGGVTNPRGRGCEREAGSLTIQSGAATNGHDSPYPISSAEKSGGRAGLSEKAREKPYFSSRILMFRYQQLS